MSILYRDSILPFLVSIRWENAHLSVRKNRKIYGSLNSNNVGGGSNSQRFCKHTNIIQFGNNDGFNIYT